MQKGDVVVGGLVPTDQDAPETVQPDMSTFHHPTSGLETGLPFDGLRLLASTTDVGGEAELLQGATHLGVVVAPVSSTGRALVQAHPLGMLWAGRRSGYATLSTVTRTSFMSWRLAPSTARPTGTPARFSQQAAFDAPLALVGGVGAGFPPPKGALVMAPSMLTPTPVQTLQFAIAFQSHSPQLQEHSSGHPFLKAQVGGGPGTDARGIQGLPLAAGAQHVEDAVGAGAVGNPGTAAAPTDGCSHVWGSGVAAPPRARRRSGNRRWWDWSWRLGQSAWDAGVWALSLWSLPQSRCNPGLTSRNGTASFHQLLG